MYEVVALESRCPGQDLKSKLCMVYQYRQRWWMRLMTGQVCLFAKEAATYGLLPKHCENRDKFALWVNFEKSRIAKVKRVTVLRWKVETGVRRVVVRIFCWVVRQMERVVIIKNDHAHV
jgi:hypothetical protein